VEYCTPLQMVPELWTDWTDWLWLICFEFDGFWAGYPIPQTTGLGTILRQISTMIINARVYSSKLFIRTWSDSVYIPVF
jgi:hypothetical protein